MTIPARIWWGIPRGTRDCLPLVTPDFDPGSSLDARVRGHDDRLEFQESEKVSLLDARVRGHDDRQDACPTKNTMSLV